MIYDILMFVLAILCFPTGLFLYLKFKGLVELYIRLFLMFVIIRLIGEAFPFSFDVSQRILFFVFFMLMIGWSFYPVIAETKMFKDYQKKQVEK